MEQIFKAQKAYLKPDLPEIHPGNTIKVWQKEKIAGKERTQTIQGVVIKCHKKRDLDATFTLRWIASGGIGVEKTFPLHSPQILKIEKIKSAKVRRAKLYYLRKRESLKLKSIKRQHVEKKAKLGAAGRKSSQKVLTEKGTKDIKK